MCTDGYLRAWCSSKAKLVSTDEWVKLVAGDMLLHGEGDSGPESSAFRRFERIILDGTLMAPLALGSSTVALASAVRENGGIFLLWRMLQLKPSDRVSPRDALRSRFLRDACEGEAAGVFARAFPRRQAISTLSCDNTVETLK